MIHLKICGMRELENIKKVAAMQPDMIGFIFYKKSSRYVGDGFKLPVGITGNSKRVGVFVNAPVTSVCEAVEEHSLDYVQLHGDESPEEVEQVKASGVKVIKAFAVNSAFDFSILTRYAPVSDVFLLDAKGDNYGGNGVRFSWSLLNKYVEKTPFLLSGGIRPEHMEEVLQLNHPQLWGVDVNSGVELAPGIKDVKKIEQIKMILNTNH